MTRFMRLGTKYGDPRCGSEMCAIVTIVTRVYGPAGRSVRMPARIPPSTSNATPLTKAARDEQQVHGGLGDVDRQTHPAQRRHDPALGVVLGPILSGRTHVAHPGRRVAGAHGVGPNPAAPSLDREHVRQHDERRLADGVDADVVLPHHTGVRARRAASCRREPRDAGRPPVRRRRLRGRSRPSRGRSCPAASRARRPAPRRPRCSRGCRARRAASPPGRRWRAPDRDRPRRRE